MTDGSHQIPIITEQAKAEARANPNGWVYAIAGGYDDTEAVPPQAIQGAWKVNEHGILTGEFSANPNFDPTFRKPSGWRDVLKPQR
ncbi:hypothetical protein [Novosphingobium sp. PhB165]|uniref:hypothetical protein n=1 Tax=Novosphingobium sp. PhB165 TaxID=2485105 RepID=UPI0010527AEB|nr:hypothetical protein [Novosphingobium sp. PhB165]